MTASEWIALLAVMLTAGLLFSSWSGRRSTEKADARNYNARVHELAALVGQEALELVTYCKEHTLPRIPRYGSPRVSASSNRLLGNILDFAQQAWEQTQEPDTSPDTHVLGALEQLRGAVRQNKHQAETIVAEAKSA